MPLLELICNIVVKLKSWPQACSLLALELKLEETALVNLGEKLECGRDELVPPDADLLLCNFLETIFLIGWLLATLLLNVLPEEVD